jgi:hypothetical protein
MAQIRSVVSLRAEAEEQAKEKTASHSPTVARKSRPGICGLIISHVILLKPEVLMSLPRQIALVLLTVFSVACGDSSGPPSVPPDFVLDNINGRALPTFVSPIPEGPTIVSASLHFDGAGKVLMTEHRRDINRGDYTVTNILDYRITGSEIEIGCFRPYPANLLCVADYTGSITGATLSLTIVPSEPLIYNYVAVLRTVGGT